MGELNHLCTVYQQPVCRARMGFLVFTDDVGRGEMRSSSHWRGDGTQISAAEIQKDEKRDPEVAERLFSRI